MTTKTLAGIAILAATALTTAQASFEISPGTNVFLTGTAGFKYDDNIYLTHSGEKSSGIFDLAPGFSLEMGSAALTKNIFTYSEDFVNYTDASSQNTQLANVQYDGNYKDDKLTLRLNAGYHQAAQNSRDVRLAGIVVETDTTNVTPTAEYKVDPKTTLGAGFDYENYEYKPSGLVNLETWTVPLVAYYEVAPKLEVGGGYRYRDNSPDSPVAKSDDNYFNFSARGDFDPKLTGTVDVGYNQRTIKSITVGGVHTSGRTESGLGFDAALAYAYDEKTKFNFTAKDDFGNAATGDSEKLVQFSAGATSEISDILTVDGNLFYTNFKYVTSSRQDDYYVASVGLTYKFDKHLSVRGGYSYQNDSSNVSGVSFNDNVFSVSLSARY